jgi:hypothetical protein
MDQSDHQAKLGSAPSPASSLLNRTFWIALCVLLLLQLGIAVALCYQKQGQEFANDASDYHKYLQNPAVLLTDTRASGLGGGILGAPLLPYLIYLPYKAVTALGIPEEYRQFLGLRLVMIGWATLGFILTWKVLQRTWNIQPTARDQWLALLILGMPLNLIAPAVMTQDDCVCFGWAGVCFYCWQRWGVGVLVICLAAGVWMVKPFLLFMFPAIWMSYPAWRTRTVVICGAVTASLLGFYFWRDGNLAILKYAENGSNSATLYSVGWLLQPNFSLAGWHEHGPFVKLLSTPILLVTMTIWCLRSWSKPYSLPAAAVGTYYVFFLSQTIVMPEYDLWFLPWTMWIMWQSARNRQWLLFALCWLHSSIEYLYKFLYACDGVHFQKDKNSPLESFYQEHFGYDLRWALSAAAIAATLCRLGIIVSLWRQRDKMAAMPYQPVDSAAAAGVSKSVDSVAK